MNIVSIFQCRVLKYCYEPKTNKELYDLFNQEFSMGYITETTKRMKYAQFVSMIKIDQHRKIRAFQTTEKGQAILNSIIKELTSDSHPTQDS